MTAVSATVSIPNLDFQDLETLADISLTTNKKYSIQAQGLMEIKVANAIFLVNNQSGTLTKLDDTVYVRTLGVPVIFTILECA